MAMITTFPFEDTQDLIDFLYFNSTIGTWQAQLVRLTAINGMTMDISTKVRNAKGLITYLQFENVKPLLTNFLNNNQYMKINVEIKLQYPDAARHIMDPTDAYTAFWLNCFSDSISNNTFASISYLETTKELPTEPITSWTVHIHSLYNDYQNSKL